MRAFQNSNSSVLNRYFLAFSLIFLSISPAFLLGDGNRPLGLIFFMALTPLFAIGSKFEKPTIILLLFCSSIFISGGVVNSDSARWSTMLYTLMFASLYISYNKVLRQNVITIEYFIKICRFIIAAYFLMLVIQQICVLVGFPVLNVSNYDTRYPWKLNSLAAEPSHTARIVGVAMSAYILAMQYLKDPISKRKFEKSNAYVWCAFLWSMLTLGSATAIIIVIVNLLVVLGSGRRRSWVIAFAVLFLSISFGPEEQINRIRSIFEAIATLDYSLILAADHSGGLRIAPMILLYERIELFSFTGLFGHGIDSVSAFMSEFIVGVPEGFAAGGTMLLLYEYGSISFVLFLTFSLCAMRLKGKPIFVLYWFLMVVIAGVNGQMIWLAIILFSTLRHFQKNMSHQCTAVSSVHCTEIQ